MSEIQYGQTVAAQEEYMLMRRAKIESDVSDGMYDAEYADFIMERSKGERIISNGDMLIDAMESGDYFESFCDYLENK